MPPLAVENIPYPFADLWANGQVVTIADIARQAAPARSAFEEAAFRFIREWLGGASQFELQTSGSTGAPKTIVVRKDQMIASARMTAAALGLKQGHTAVVCLDTRYIAGKMMLVRSLVAGMRIMLLNPSANPLLALPPNYTFDFIAMVPYQAFDVLRSPEGALLPASVNVIVGGAPLDAETQKRVLSSPARWYETYGMTETLSHIALRKLNGPAASGNFTALPGVTLRVDERGCLVIEAPHLHGPVVTNDLVALRSPSEFTWLGRWDNVINTGGVKVLPERVEPLIQEVLNELGLHPACFIAGMPDAKLGQKVVLVWEGDPPADHLREIFFSRLAHLLTRFEIPKDLVCLPVFVRTETGKISRQKTIEIVTKPL